MHAIVIYMSKFFFYFFFDYDDRAISINRFNLIKTKTGRFEEANPRTVNEPAISLL